jgi:FtsH-binding integral membrane protein
MIIDVAVLLVFPGFVLYDMPKILYDYSDDQVTDAVLALYLDFLNIFIRILELLILTKRRRYSSRGIEESPVRLQHQIEIIDAL